MKTKFLLLLLCFVLLLGSLPTAIAAAEPASTTGDVNADGAVNMKDVLSLRKALAGLDTATAGDGDVNLDGGVNMKDVLCLRRYLAGLETLPTIETTESTTAQTTVKTTRTTKAKTTWATKYPIDHNAPRINFIDESAATLGVWWWHVSDAYNETLGPKYMTLLEEN